MAYGQWNMDKDAEPGQTRELISAQAKLLGTPKLEKLGYLPKIESDTLIDIFERAEGKWPNNDWLGTYANKKYEWSTVRDIL
jgi:hypothetical protein